MQSLSVLYRPQDFNEVVGQSSIVKILEQQINQKNYKHAYLFCGPTGCGKTTLSRILATKINGSMLGLEELDAASNNGVENVRNIVKSAKERSVNSQYKIFLIDECHAITNAGWQAFLKCIEEPPAYTIFMFCTTEANKVPATIINRCQRYNLSKISTNAISERLKYICNQEKFTYTDEAIDFISKVSDGGMRDAISRLEKVISLSTEVNIENTLTALGSYSYNVFFNLVNAIIDGNEKEIIDIIANIYYEGADLQLFINEFFKFCLDITKYTIFQNMSLLEIPSSQEEKIKNSINFDNASKYYMIITNKILELKNLLKNETNLRAIIEVTLLNISRWE